MCDILSSVDVDGVCRLCLKGDGTIIPIFGRENTSRDCIPLSKKIFDCVSVKISSEDGMPNMICVGCVHQVDSWHGFKTSCDKTQHKLLTWLERTKPDLFAKNRAEQELAERAKSTPQPQTSAVISLSSDDDDEVVMTTFPPPRRSIHRNTPRVRNRPSRQPQSIDLLSIPTNVRDEIEILPVSDANTRPQKNFDCVEIFPSTKGERRESAPVTETNLQNPFVTVSLNSSDDHILPDTNVPHHFTNLDHSTEHFEGKVLTKETSKETIPAEEPKKNSEEPTEDVVSMAIEHVQINETEFNILPDNESQEQDTLAANPLDSQDSSQTPVAALEESQEVVENNDVDKIESTISNLNKQNDSLINQSSTTKDPDNSNETCAEIPSDNSALMIEQVTSLTNNDDTRMDCDINSQEITSSERMDVEENNECSQDEPRADDDSDSGEPRESIEEITIVDDNWHNQNNDEESQDSLQPDILGVSVKEEPVSAEDEIVEEDDPLNFHSITIKREPTDWALNENEPMDVKPNIQQLNEAIQIQPYTPKRLKNNKVLCEPCRNSFGTEKSYERHTSSIRHRINLKLFLAGKGPTAFRRKNLVSKNARHKNITLFTKDDEVGHFYCSECPSVFRHRRNLHTHKKKHLMQIRSVAPIIPEFTKVRETSLERPDSRSPSISSQDSSMSSKSQRVSAQSAKFKFKEELKCEVCSKQFANLSGMFTHKRFCGITMYSKRCRSCDQKFTTHSQYAKHRKACRELHGVKHWRDERRNETPPPPRRPPVEKPTTSQTTPSSVPLDGTVLACTLCSLTFETSSALITHMQENHMDFGKPQSPLPNFARPNNANRYNDSRMHYCKYCLKSFPSVGAMTSHAGYHVRQAMFWCKFCKHSPFTDKLTFRQHMKVHISNPTLNKNVCWICYTKFDSPQTLRDHRVNHTNMNVRVFSCNYCENSYNTKELLSKHRKVAHHSNPAELAVNHNMSDYFSAQVKESKVELIDEDYKPHKCRICKKKFTSIGNLKRHMHNIHPKGGTETKSAPVNGPSENSHQTSLKCAGCSRSFNNQIGLMKHRHYCLKYKRTPSFAQNMIKCQDCKKFFASKNTLYKHRLFKRCRPEGTKAVEQNHLKSYDCPNCDQQFLSQESLLRHKQHCKPTIDRLTCDCGEVFSSVELKWSHTESCSLNSTCKMCKVKFNSPDELECHKEVCKPDEDSPPSPPSVTPRPKSTVYHETRSPPLDCPKCNKRFVYQKSYQVHQEKCFNDRWPCSGCPEIFPNETALSKHKSACNHYTPQKLNRSSSFSSLEGPNFKCEYCPMLFMTGNELKQHLVVCEYKLPPQTSPTVRESGYDYNKQFSCNLCGKSFSWKANLQRHQKQAHSGNESLNSSGGSESTRVSMENITATSNSETTIGFYKCKLCPDIVFHKKQGFLEHRMVHEREAARRKEVQSHGQNEESALLTCELCEKKLPEALYHLHMDEHMNDDFEDSTNEPQVADSSTADDQVSQTFPCDICGKVFYTDSSKKSHRASHYRAFGELSHLKSPPKKKKTFKAKHVRCNICYKLLSINSMPKHKMMHRREQAEFYNENGGSTPVKYASSTPNNASSTTVEVEVMLTEGSGEIGNSSPTVFPCPKCDKTFKLRKSLMDHLKTHSDDNMETESVSSAPGHIDEFSYKCVYCDLSWKYKSLYERHLSSKKHQETQKQLANII